MNDIFFTSDTHFGHRGIIKFCSRPFDNADEMDEKIIENWNAKVGHKDTIYHLGDFGMFRDFEHTKSIFNRLNGKKYFLMGNHDRPKLKQLKWMHVYDGPVTVKVDGNYFELLHYPMIEWNRFFKGAYHLYGHVHGNLGEGYCRSMDVGIDALDELAPIHWTEVVEKLQHKENKHLEDFT